MSQSLIKGGAATAQDLAKTTSTTTTKETTDAAAAPTQPIQTLASQEAQTLRHAHPAALLALFALRFRALVADPVSTMQTSLPAVLALQAAYTTFCLPAAGAPTATTAPRKLRPGERKKAAGADGGGSHTAVVSLFLPLLLFIFFFLFGYVVCGLCWDSQK